jgi:hypothetical protein
MPSCAIAVVNRLLREDAAPRRIVGSTAVLLLAGVLAFAAWWHTGNPVWIRAYFYYPGALFFIACSLLEVSLAYRCWREFSPGDLLRPAWLLILLSAVSRLAGGLVRHIGGLETWLNPLSYLPAGWGHLLTQRSFEAGELFSPLSMALLAIGLLHVLRACRRNGVLGSLKPVDVVLLSGIILYTVYYFSHVVLSPLHPEGPVNFFKIIGWTSDPLLCVLLLEAVLIRRSAANLGWGWISRCWISYTAAILLTSLGDVGLWASANGLVPYWLEAASWYVWFIASASYALGPAYQLQAMLSADDEARFDEALLATARSEVATFY